MPKVALIIGAGLGLFAATAGITSTLLNSQPPWLAVFRRSPQPASTCKTIATDPNPPLNVRSSPVVAPDNIVGKLKNGTPLTIVDENEGWVRISSPLEGWVYKELTVTSCAPAVATSPSQPTATDAGESTLAEAREFYNAGNLNAAIALAQTVSPNSTAYQEAQTAISKWPQDWKTAEAEFYSAQKAHREGRWQDVLQTVKRYPDNRFWRAKLTPLVQDAIKRQSS